MPNVNRVPELKESVYLARQEDDTWAVRSESVLQDRGNGGRSVFLVDFEAMRLYPVDVLDYTDVDYVLSVSVPGEMVGMPGLPTQPVLRGDDQLPDQVMGPDGAIADMGSIFRRGSGE